MLSHDKWVLIGLTSLIAAAQPVFAQSSNQVANEGPAIEEVTVNARRIEENVQKIPVSVTVVTAAKLQELNINSPIDLTKIAGLGDQPAGSDTRNTNFTIRGQGQNLGGAPPGVIPYFAEVPNFPLQYFDLQNIQVLKGPQGTLFGQTSTGGVILFEPHRPDLTKLGGFIDLEAGDYEYKQFKGAVNLPLIEDKLAVRVAAQRRERRGYIKGYFSDGEAPTDLDNLDNTSWRISVDWKPTDKLEDYFLYTGSIDRSHGQGDPLFYVDVRFLNPQVRNLPPGLVPSIAAGFQFWTGVAPPAGQTFGQLAVAAYNQERPAGPRVSFSNFPSGLEQRATGFVNQTTYQVLDNLRLRNIFSMNWASQKGASWDLDGTPLPLLEVRCPYVSGTTSQSGECERTGGWPSRTWSDELQLQGSLIDQRLQWQTGFFYLRGGSRKWEPNSGTIVAFGTASGNPAGAGFCTSVGVTGQCTQLQENTNYTYAGFGQVTYEIVKDVRLTAGYRETWNYSRTDATATAFNGVSYLGQTVSVPFYNQTPTAGAGIVSTVVDLPSQASYNISVDWQATDNVLLYAAHRKGFKTGGINSTANPGTPNRVYGPETVKDIEIGAKTEWSFAGIRGQTNLAYYYSWYDNIQLSTFLAGTPNTIISNIANETISGFELEETIYPRDWFRLSGNLAYTDGKYKNWSETALCSVQYWVPLCAGQPGTTPILVNHAAGTVTVNGQTLSGAPDRTLNISKYQWSIQPALLLKDWIGEDVVISANIYGRTPFVDQTAAANNTRLLGLTPVTLNTIYGTFSESYTNPGYTLANLRIDWNNVFAKPLGLGIAVTNVTDKVYRVNAQSLYEVTGTAYSIPGEPRMFWLNAKYEF